MIFNKIKIFSRNLFELVETFFSGDLLEVALERVPHLSLHKNYADRKWDSDGVEWYRRIMTALSDKSMVEQLQQRLCRQLAEVLLRGMLDGGYDVSSHSKAINLKSESLK